MELSELRSKIDATDEQLLRLFLERMAISANIAAYKAERRLPILNREREREILKQVAANSGDLERYSHRLFTTLFELSRAYQSALSAGASPLGQKLRALAAAPRDEFPQRASVACQGVEGAYAQMAADKLFPRGELMLVRTYEGVFGAVESGLCQFGLLPIENSSHGSVLAIYHLLHKRRVSVVRSIRLCVRHELLARPGTTLESVREICSHEQALGQCSEFLGTLGSEVKITALPNTAMAAQYAAEHDGAAAIASHSCAELYGLAPIGAKIQNSDNNYTRFICIAKEPKLYPGANRISLMLSSEHRPGALYGLMAKFAALGLNLTKLESYPMTGHDFEFMFFFDLEASILDPAVIGMLEDLERSCETFIFLGNYLEV